MTVTTVYPRFAVDAPAVPAPRGGLLDVASVVDVTARSLGAAGVDYVTGPCGVAGLAPGLCLPNSDIPVDTEKEIQSPQTIEGEPFAVYRRVGCTMFDEPLDQMAKDSFARGEPWAVEKAFAYSLLQHATVIPGGDTPQSAALVVGELEQLLAGTYGGVPTLLTSRTGGVILGSQNIAFPGMSNQLTTIHGTPIGSLLFDVADPQVAPGPPAPDAFWIFATGHIGLWKGALFASEPVRDTSTNESSVLVERVWSAAVECEVYAAQATVCPCSISG